MNKGFHSLRVASVFGAALLLASCQKDQAVPKDQELTVAPFESMEVVAGSNVELTEGPTERIKLRGNQNLMSKLKTGVDNGTWKVEFEGNVPDQDQLTILVTMPRLRRLVHTGPGTIRGLTSFSSPTLAITNTGSGSVILGAITTDVDVEVKGSGPVELTGTAVNQLVRVAGSGSYRGFGLRSANTDATVSGSGSAEVWATSTLRATVPGSGNVRYKGRPTITASTPGPGRVIDSN